MLSKIAEFSSFLWKDIIPLCGEGNGTPLQYSCLENPMDGGAWWAAVHGVSRSWTRLSDITFHFPALEKEMATHSSALAWRIPGTAEPGGLPSYGVAQSRTRLKRLSSSSSSSSNMHRRLHQIIAEYTFLSSDYRTFSKIYHILNQKINLTILYNCNHIEFLLPP